MSKNSTFRSKSYPEKLEAAKRAQERRRAKVRKTRENTPQRHLRPNKRQSRPLSKLVKDLDTLVSRYVRLSRADKSGYVRCFTSGKMVHWKEIQCGHYISRSVRATRWHLDNLRPQSVGENIFKSGNPITFRENLVKEIGEDKVKAVEKLRHAMFKPPRSWFEEEIARYTALVQDL